MLLYNLHNPKNLWKIIRNLAPSNHSNSPNHLTIDGKTLTNPKDIADSFNDHLTNTTNSVSLNNFTNNSNWDYLSNFFLLKFLQIHPLLSPQNLKVLFETALIICLKLKPLV